MTERRRIPAEVFPPGKFIEEELLARGISVVDFAYQVGLTPLASNMLFTGGLPLNTGIANELGKFLGTDPELWLGLEQAYRAWLAQAPPEEEPEPEEPPPHVANVWAVSLQMSTMAKTIAELTERVGELEELGKIGIHRFRGVEQELCGGRSQIAGLATEIDTQDKQLLQHGARIDKNFRKIQRCEKLLEEANQRLAFCTAMGLLYQQPPWVK